MDWVYSEDAEHFDYNHESSTREEAIAKGNAEFHPDDTPVFWIGRKRAPKLPRFDLQWIKDSMAEEEQIDVDCCLDWLGALDDKRRTMDAQLTRSVHEVLDLHGQLPDWFIVDDIEEIKTTPVVDNRAVSGGVSAVGVFVVRGFKDVADVVSELNYDIFERLGEDTQGAMLFEMRFSIEPHVYYAGQLIWREDEDYREEDVDGFPTMPLKEHLFNLAMETTRKMRLLSYKETREDA